MVSPDKQQLMSALILLVLALFISAGWVRAPYGLWIRRAALVGFLLTVGIAVVWITAWVIG
jgi:hypothetical protein